MFNKLGQAIYDQRKSKTGLARQLGVSRNTIHNYMRGPINIPLQVAFKLAELLNIDINELKENG